MSFFKKMKCSLFIIVMFIPVNSIAQYKKVPDISHESNDVNSRILKGHYKGYKVFDLELFPDKMLDTITFSQFTFYPSALLKEAIQYKYTKWEQMENLAYWRKLGRFQQGTRTLFIYDAHGNIRSKKTSDIFPRNSYMALMNLMMRDKHLYEVPLNIDSILTAGVPEQISDRVAEIFTYNKDGNAVYSKDSVTGMVTVYKYAYNKDKRVTIQRRTSYGHGSAHVTSVLEFHFGYDKMGNLDSIKLYNSTPDTVNVISLRNSVYEIGRAYDTNRNVIREYIMSQQTGIPRETVITYSDTLMIGRITIEKNYRNDTDEIMEYMRDSKGRLTEVKKKVFNEGKRYAEKREEYDYDDAGNIKEIRYFVRNPLTATKEIMNKKTIYVWF